MSSRRRRPGKRITSNALRPVSEAVTVRISQGQVLVTDGPFSETKEWIARFDILECDDLDEAIAIAARHPQANGGKLEFRPVLDRRGLKVAPPRPGRSLAAGAHR